MIITICYEISENEISSITGGGITAAVACGLAGFVVGLDMLEAYI